MMGIESIRNIIARALEEHGHHTISLGNTVHVIGSTDYEIIIKTMRPFEKGGVVDNINQGVVTMSENQQQINAETEEWITIIDPDTMLPKRVLKANYSLTEVRPGVTAAQPKRRPLNEA